MEAVRALSREVRAEAEYEYEYERKRTGSGGEQAHGDGVGVWWRTQKVRTRHAGVPALPSDLNTAILADLCHTGEGQVARNRRAGLQR